MTTTPRARVGRFLVFAALSAVVLQRLDVGGAATPPWRSWGALDGWYDTVGPSAAVVGVVRVLAIGACGWLVLACGLQLLAATVRSAPLRRLADCVSPRFLRSLACGATSLSVTVGLAMPAAAFGPPEPAPGTAVMVPLDITTSTTAPTTTTTSVPPLTTSTTTAPTTTAPPTATPAAPVAPVRVSPPPAAEVVVVPGDSFWSIAVDEADGQDVTTYWRALIEANRDRLVDRANPDLLYPDQVLRLP